MAFRARALSLLLALLLGASGAQAQHRWNAKEKHWYKDLIWWIGEGVIVTAFILDAHSTALVLDRCPSCRESSPLLGPRPSTRAIVVGSSLLFAFETGLHIGSWETCPDPNWDDQPWRTACYALIPGLTAPRFFAAAHNYHIAARHESSFPKTISKQLRSTSSSASGQFAMQERMGSTYHSSFPMERYLECGQIALLCTSFQQTAAAPKRDLRSVQFR